MERLGKRFCTKMGECITLVHLLVTRGEIFSLKFTKFHLAAGLRPDPLGELKRSPRPPSRNKGRLLLRGGEWTGGAGREVGRVGGKGGELAPSC